MKTKIYSFLILVLLIQITQAKNNFEKNYHPLHKKLHISKSFSKENSKKPLKKNETIAIPDDNFEQALIDLGYDDVLDNVVNAANISNIETLDVSNKQITDLTGIEAFINLNYLDASNNSLQNINLTNLTKLVNLKIENNRIGSTINLSNNDKLQSLYATRNRLETLDVSKNTKLINLDLSYNGFTTIDLTLNINLVYLNLSHRSSRTISGIGGNFDSFTFGSLRSIDISNNILLQELQLQGNLLTTLNVSNNTELRKLFIHENRFTAINTTNNTLLEELQLQNNSITTIDVSNNTNLTKILVHENRLTAIDVSTNLLLNILDVSKNDLSSLNVSMLESLTVLKTLGNDLNCVSVFNVAYANENWRTYAEANTVFLNSCNNPLVYVPDDNFEQALIDLGFDDVLDDYVLRANIENLTELNLREKRIDDLTGLEAFISLINLDFSNNLGIENINLNKLTQLKKINFSGNLMSNIDISKNILLEEVLANETRFESLDIDDLTELKKLEIIHNQDLNALNVSNNLKLEYLVLINSKLTSIDLSNNTLLDEVNFQGNKLTDIDVTKNINLKRLFLSSNKLDEIDVSKNLALERLNVSGNNLSMLDLRMLENLQFLYTQGNNLHCISVFDVSYANQYWKTFADANTIFVNSCDDLIYVPDDKFEQALINLGYDDVIDNYILKSNVENIITLDISNKEIENLTGIQAFTNLEILKCNDNKLNRDFINFESLTKLKSLFIQNNLLNSTFNITKNVALEELNASQTLITILDITKNINLKKINLTYNNLTYLDITNNTLLEILEVIGNKLNQLNTTNNTLLQELNAQSNQLTSIDLTTNVNLKKLYLPENGLYDLDVSQNILLEILSVGNNALSSLYLRNNTNLHSLFAKNNQLRCISVYNVNYAQQNWANNVDDNMLFDLDCSLWVYIPDDNFEQAMIDAGYDLVLDNFMSANMAKQQTVLNLIDKQITDFTGIEGFTNLENLNCSGNNISNADLSKNTKLKVLFFGNNPLYFLDVSKNTEITTLVISGTNVNYIDLTNNLHLKNFTALSTQLSFIDISKNTELEYLNLDNNNLYEFKPEYNTKIKELIVSRNNISKINLTNNRLLEKLDVSNNNLSMLDIKNNFRLTSFKAKNNSLTCINTWDVPYAIQNWANEIDATASFGDNCYTYVPDDNFESALISLGLDENMDNYILTSNIINVQTLDLSSKFISDATGIEGFINLKELLLKGNELTTLNISQNTQLIKLNVSNNLLDRLDISNNRLLENFEALQNKLTCIKVWNVNYAINSWSNLVDSTVNFSLDCDNIWTIEVDEELKSLITIVAGLDKDNDGEITLAEAKEFAGALDLSGKNLEDIKGLEAFVNLTTLNLSNNNIKDLSKLTGKKITLINKTTGAKKVVETTSLAIENLNISNNNLETLSLDNLTNLKTIDISNNPELINVSLKNGRNMDITLFKATNTRNLSCIYVDDVNASYLTNWVKEEKAVYVLNEAECRASVLNIEEFIDSDVSMYPNPVSKFLTINSKKNIEKVEVYNILGSKLIETSNLTIDFSKFNTGVYIVKLTSENKILTKRILKN